MVKKPSYEELEQRVKELEKAALERKKAEEPLQEFEQEKEVILKSLVEHVIYPPFRIIFLKILELQGFTRFSQKM